MKSILFGLALLCALPGCCGGMWDCNKDKEPKEKKSCKTDCKKSDKKSRNYDRDDRDMKSGKNYKK